MRKILASIGVAAVLALGLFVGTNVTAPKQAKACGTWVIENGSNESYISFYSQYLNGTDNLWSDLVTYSDGCGAKQYEVLIWTQYGTPINSFDNEVRVWVCGVYKGATKSTSSVVWSPAYVYGSCGRQADNYLAHIWTPWFNNGNSYVYTVYLSE